MLAWLIVPFLVLAQDEKKSGSMKVETVTPATQEAPGPKLDTGPLRVELLGFAELRVKTFESIRDWPKSSEVRLEFRVQGEGVDRIIRQGELIFSEAVDSAGTSLLEPDLYTEAQKTAVRPVTTPPDRLRAAGLQLRTRISKAPERKFATLKKLRGSIRVLLQDGPPEQVTIDHPLQFKGKFIENAMLKQIGMDVRILPAEDVKSQTVPADRTVVIQVKSKEENLNKTLWFDGSMRPVRQREVPVTLPNGESAKAYVFEPNVLNNEVQVVFEFYPKLEDKTLTVQIDDFQLP